jgi:acetyl esterase/lipase
LKSKATAALVGLLVAAGALGGVPPALAAPSPGPAVRPQLLLFHGGVFLFPDRNFQARTRGIAMRAGFVPHYVDYPLGDLPGAVAAAEEAARDLDAEYGTASVYAYGSSAGGDLAAILAGRGLVTAARPRRRPRT